MGTIIIIIIGIVGFGMFTFFEGKRQGYSSGLHDGYEECKRNQNKINEFKQKILNKKFDIWKDTK